MSVAGNNPYNLPTVSFQSNPTPGATTGTLSVYGSSSAALSPNDIFGLAALSQQNVDAGSQLYNTLLSGKVTNFEANGKEAQVQLPGFFSSALASAQAKAVPGVAPSPAIPAVLESTSRQVILPTGIPNMNASTSQKGATDNIPGALRLQTSPDLAK